MRYFFPFQIVTHRAAMEYLTGAAPEQDAATINLSQHEEEHDGGTEEVKGLICLGGNAEYEAEH